MAVAQPPPQISQWRWTRTERYLLTDWPAAIGQESVAVDFSWTRSLSLSRSRHDAIFLLPWVTGAAPSARCNFVLRSFYFLCMAGESGTICTTSRWRHYRYLTECLFSFFRYSTMPNFATVEWMMNRICIRSDVLQLLQGYFSPYHNCVWCTVPFCSCGCTQTWARMLE